MAEIIEESISNRSEKELILGFFPCFSSLNSNQRAELANLCKEMKYLANEMIVKEDDLVDSVYIIKKGEAEVTHRTKFRKKEVKVPIAMLHPGEAIGLNDTGFYSSTGKWTATVTAVTDMTIIRLDIKDLYAFLKRNNLELSMYAASEQMLRMKFIKQSLPFSKISYERLQWLAEKVEEINLAKDTILFNEGEQGDKCYLIRSGQVEVYTTDENGNEKQLALLKPPVLFGEATLIANAPRNASARAVEDCVLFVLDHKLLSELIENESNVASMFMTLMVDRSRPIQNKNVTIHQRRTADGQELTILKNKQNNTYFKLSVEGFYIWQQLDGKHTLRDMTLSLAEKYNVFAPDMVTALISKLTRTGFVENVELDSSVSLAIQPIWVKILAKIRKAMDIRFAFGDADPMISKLYEKYVKILFTRKGKIGLLILFVTGLISFFLHTSEVFGFFQKEPIGMVLAMTLLPLSVFELFLHELGHAFAVKACGREVHYIGLGWGFSGPVAFTDTSDMWLAPRKSRIMVNLAGVWVDVVIAGLASILMCFTSNHYVLAILWMFALYTYIGAFRILSPLQEYDGYFALMDWLEKNHLRQPAVLWLVKVFPKALRKPALFRLYPAEIIYWAACIAYLIAVTLLTLAVQNFVLKAVGLHTGNKYYSLILPFFVLLFTSVTLLAEIKQQAEE